MNSSNNTYLNYIDDVYNTNLVKINFYDDPKKIYGLCGKIYDSIFKKNLEYGLWKDINKFDHKLIEYIAGSVKESVDNVYTNDMSYNDLINNIKSSIFDWINAEKIRDYSEHINNVYNTNLVKINFYEKPDIIYGLCGKVYDSIFRKNLECGFWKDINKFDHTLVSYIAGWVKKNINNIYTNAMSHDDLNNNIKSSIFTWINSKNNPKKDEQPNPFVFNIKDLVS